MMYEPAYQSKLRHLHESQSKCDEGKSQRTISHTPIRHNIKTTHFTLSPTHRGRDTRLLGVSCGVWHWDTGSESRVLWIGGLGRHGLGSGEFQDRINPLGSLSRFLGSFLSSLCEVAGHVVLLEGPLLLGSAREVAHIVYIGVCVGGGCQVVSGWINVNHVTCISIRLICVYLPLHHLYRR